MDQKNMLISILKTVLRCVFLLFSSMKAVFYWPKKVTLLRLFYRLSLYASVTTLKLVFSAARPQMFSLAVPMCTSL